MALSPLVYRDFIGHTLDLLKASLGEDVKAYYEGDPIHIGESSLPCIIVMKHEGAATAGPTGFDRISSQYLIKLVVDKRVDFGGSVTADLTDRRLRMMVEGRDLTTGLFLPNSIIGIIRTHYTLNDVVALNPLIDQNLKWKYWVIPRPEDVVTNEAHITLDVVEYLNIPNRI